MNMYRLQSNSSGAWCRTSHTRPYSYAYITPVPTPVLRLFLRLLSGETYIPFRALHLTCVRTRRRMNTNCLLAESDATKRRQLPKSAARPSRPQRATPPSEHT